MLTDQAIKRIVPADKPKKYTDGHGLHLYVSPAGSKTWRYKYLFGGKEKLLTIGRYPEVSLKEAREHMHDARKLLRTGVDPMASPAPKTVGTAATPLHTLETVARDWHRLNSSRWSVVHCNDIIHSLERDVFPALGSKGIKEITVPELLSVLRSIETRPAIETAHRVRQRLEAVFTYGIASGICDNNPAMLLKKALAPKPLAGKQPAVTTLELARSVLQSAINQNAHPVTHAGLIFIALTAVRPNELRFASWEEFRGLDGEEPTWWIPRKRMKATVEGKNAGDYHLVPLSAHAVDTLKALRHLTGNYPYVFPAVRHVHKPMSENALGYLLNRAGWHGKQSAHGFRAVFSTIMNDRFSDDEAIIDLMLAHKPKNKVSAAYNRALHLNRRRQLALIWSDLIMEDLTFPDDSNDPYIFNFFTHLKNSPSFTKRGGAPTNN